MQVQDLWKAFGGQSVLRGVHLSLRQGEVVLLRGANGSGKTTLINILTGHLKPDRGTITVRNGHERRYRFPRPLREGWNPSLAFTPEHLASLGVSRSWQDGRLFDTQTLRDNIAVAAPNHPGERLLHVLVRSRRVRSAERQNLSLAHERLQQLGLGNRATSSADKVSLGQAKRVAIARAVHARARLLFLDEPLAGLDHAGIGEVLTLLRRIAHDELVTLVIVEHVLNIPHLIELATEVWTLADGHLTVQPASSVREALRVSHRRAPFSDDWVGAFSMLCGAPPSTHELTDGALLHLFVPSGIQASEPALELEAVKVCRDRRRVIGYRGEGADEGLSLRIGRGQLALLEAPNGWGKTTLLETIAGLLPLSGGTIRLFGKDARSLPPWARSCSLLQARGGLFPSLTVRESLRLAGVERIPLDLAPLSQRLVSSLSGGERQRLALTSVLHGRPAPLYLLDEPFAALDAEALEGMMPHLWAPDGRHTTLVALPHAA